MNYVEKMLDNKGKELNIKRKKESARKICEKLGLYRHGSFYGVSDKVLYEKSEKKIYVGERFNIIVHYDNFILIEYDLLNSNNFYVYGSYDKYAEFKIAYNDYDEKKFEEELKKIIKDVIDKIEYIEIKE